MAPQAESEALQPSRTQSSWSLGTFRTFYRGAMNPRFPLPGWLARQTTTRCVSCSSFVGTLCFAIRYRSRKGKPKSGLRLPGPKRHPKSWIGELTDPLLGFAVRIWSSLPSYDGGVCLVWRCLHRSWLEDHLLRSHLTCCGAS